MDTMVEPAKRKRRAPNKIDLDQDKVKLLLDKGLSQKDIAATQGVSRWTIARFVDECQQEFKAVDMFKQHRAEIFSRLAAKNLSLQNRILDRLNDDGILAALTPSQMASITFALNSQHGTIYDKERLERGQSTQNHSIMTKMLHSSVESAMKSTGSQIVVVPPGDHNIPDDEDLPAVDAAPPVPSVGEEAGRGDSPAADVSGHPTESQCP